MSVGLNVPILASLHQSRADAHLQTWGAGVHVVSGLLVAETRTWDMFHLDHVVCNFCEGHIVWLLPTVMAECDDLPPVFQVHGEAGERFKQKLVCFALCTALTV